MFFTKKALIASILSLALLVAPAAMAAPDEAAPTSWTSWFQDLVDDLSMAFGLVKSTTDGTASTTDDGTSGDDPSLDPGISGPVTQTMEDGGGGESSPFPEPNG